VGRLHDPLDCLAERVYRALTLQRRIVTVDENGRVFIVAADIQQPDPARSIVGMYDVFTTVLSIEADLRLALRERASRWIIDWSAPMPIRVDPPMHQFPPPRRRRRRVPADVDGKRLQRRPAPASGEIRAPA
jgi:hypothetical protein